MIPHDWTQCMQRERWKLKAVQVTGLINPRNGLLATWHKSIQEITWVYCMWMYMNVYEFNQQESWAFLLHMFRSRHVRFSTWSSCKSEDEKTENVRIMTHCPLRTSTENIWKALYHKSTNIYPTLPVVLGCLLVPCANLHHVHFSFALARSQGVTAESTGKFFYSILSWRSWTCGQWKAILLCLCWIKITLSARLVQSAPEKSLKPELVSAQQPTFCLEDLNGTKAIDRYRVRPSWVQNMCVESIQSCWGSMSSCRFKNETLGQEGMRRQ